MINEGWKRSMREMNTNAKSRGPPKIIAVTIATIAPEKHAKF